MPKLNNPEQSKSFSEGPLSSTFTSRDTGGRPAVADSSSLLPFIDGALPSGQIGSAGELGLGHDDRIRNGNVLRVGKHTLEVVSAAVGDTLHDVRGITGDINFGDWGRRAAAAAALTSVAAMGPTGLAHAESKSGGIEAGRSPAAIGQEVDFRVNVASQPAGLGAESSRSEVQLVSNESRAADKGAYSSRRVAVIPDFSKKDGDVSGPSQVESKPEVSSKESAPPQPEPEVQPEERPSAESLDREKRLRNGVTKIINEQEVYAQRNPLWANVNYGGNTTVGSAGCVRMATFAAAASLNLPAPSTKEEVVGRMQESVRNGDRVVGSGTTNYSIERYFKEVGGKTKYLDVRTDEKYVENIKNTLAAGGKVITAGKVPEGGTRSDAPGLPSGHVYVITGYEAESNKFYGIDSEGTEKSGTPWDPAVITEQMRFNKNNQFALAVFNPNAQPEPAKEPAVEAEDKGVSGSPVKDLIPKPEGRKKVTTGQLPEGSWSVKIDKIAGNRDGVGYSGKDEDERRSENKGEERGKKKNLDTGGSRSGSVASIGEGVGFESKAASPRVDEAGAGSSSEHEEQESQGEADRRSVGVDTLPPSVADAEAEGGDESPQGPSGGSHEIKPTPSQEPTPSEQPAAPPATAVSPPPPSPESESPAPEEESSKNEREGVHESYHGPISPKGHGTPLKPGTYAKATITAGFDGYNNLRYAGGRKNTHTGVDFSGAGMSVLATKAGKVIMARGNTILIKHGDDEYTNYQHVNVKVKVSDRVLLGQEIGITTVADGHLHYGNFREGRVVSRLEPESTVFRVARNPMKDGWLPSQRETAQWLKDNPRP